jgi:hypothetical protein
MFISLNIFLKFIKEPHASSLQNPKRSEAGDYQRLLIAIWFVAGRFTQMTCPIFLTLSIGWEIMEWFLPFEFASENHS